MPCKHCGGETSDWKCETCGAESAAHDPAHGCGGDHCVAKCSGCSEAETKCACG